MRSAGTERVDGIAVAAGAERVTRVAPRHGRRARASSGGLRGAGWRRAVAFVAGVALLAGRPAAAQEPAAPRPAPKPAAARVAPAPRDYRAEALRILKTVPLIDGHNDIPDKLRALGGPDTVSFDKPQPTLMTDLPRIHAGELSGQFWAAYVPVTTMDSGVHPAVYALEQMDIIKRLCAKYPKQMAMAYTAADVERNFRAGKFSCLIGIEGGHAIENSLGALRMFYALGARYMTLTHWRSTDWATASTDTAHKGLSPFGKQVVREMNRLGMLVDLSHVNDGTMSDAIHTSLAPVIFSHSSARALTDHARDVPDSILRLIPANGGVVMVNFYPPFVNESVRRFEDSVDARARALRRAGVDSAAVRDSIARWNRSKPRATLKDVADHIDYVRRIAGVDHVGIGSDFDGVDEWPVGLEDVSKYPDLFAELLRRGWTAADLRKLAGENILRVMRQAEAVARRLEAEPGR